MSIKCIVVDDEQLARKGIIGLIQQFSFLKFIGEAKNTKEAHELLEKEKVDLVFLDIEMPKINGLDFLKKLEVQPFVVFTTAYPQFALQSYEYKVIDYLLKPISLERFSKAANKAKEIFDIKEVMVDAEPTLDYFFVKSDHKYEKIEFEELLFAEARQNYVLFVTIQKSYLYYITLKSVEDFLPSNKFIKINRSFILSISRIKKIEGDEIFIEGHSFKISRNKKEEIKQILLGKNSIKRH